MNKLTCLRGRLIVQLIPCSHTTKSGLYIVDRKNTSAKGVVLAVGAESMSVSGKPIKAPCVAGDTIYFRANQPKYFNEGQQGKKDGKAMVWFSDCLVVIVT